MWKAPRPRGWSEGGWSLKEGTLALKELADVVVVVREGV